MSHPGPARNRSASRLALYAGGAMGALVIAGIVVALIWGRSSDDKPASDKREGQSNVASAVTSTTAAPSPTSTTPAADASGQLPEDRVAYIDATGRVLSGQGATQPVEIASGAALGPTGLGSLAISPTGDVVAFVRSDGALVLVPVDGGTQMVVATDASLADLGEKPSLVWDPTGQRISYLAVGTQAMVEPRSSQNKPLSAGQGVFRVPLPTGSLGNVVKVVDRAGKILNRVGDPSTRSITGISGSRSDDFILVESAIPTSGDPYTIATMSSDAKELAPTLLSADDPQISPDGNYIVAVGPQGDDQELLRISTDTLTISTLARGDDICAPSISPDSTRIAYGAGKGCSKLMLISSRGGTPVDISPPGKPGTPSYRYGRVAWTRDAHFVAYSDCRSVDGPVKCDGKVSFFDPDRSLLIPGVHATTVATIAPPVLVDLAVDLILDGPVKYTGTFPVDANASAELNSIDDKTREVDVELIDGRRSLGIRLHIEEGSRFAVGQLVLKDPEKGVEQTLLVTGTPTALGIRVGSLSGMWMVTDELPFTSGEFRIVIRRKS